jgi:hypothetical protein
MAPAGASNHRSLDRGSGEIREISLWFTAMDRGKPRFPSSPRAEGAATGALVQYVQTYTKQGFFKKAEAPVS